MNQITIELCAEDRARLDRIADLLEAQTEKPVKPAKNRAPAPKKVETPASVQPEQEEPAEVEPGAQTGEEEALEVTLNDLQQLVIKLATHSPAKKAQARDIVKQYAERVTDIPEDKRAEAYTKLKALEA